MLFLKRLILGSFALGFIFMGGSGTQSNSILAQGGGFVGLILGIIVLYIFFKMAWRAMGCLPSFIMFSIVVLFILYAIGAFSNGVGNLSTNLKGFLGKNVPSKNDMIANPASFEENILEEADIVPAFEESFIEESDIIEYDAETAGSQQEKKRQSQQVQQPQQQPQQTAQQSQGGALGLGELINNVISGQQPQQQQVQEEEVAFNPANYPSIYGFPKVINADTIVINGGYLKFYAVDAPEANQTCADRQGRSYKCGREAALWLKSWITGNEIECRVVKQDKSGNMMGICSLGDYDIGAALINAGWAVADINSADIYVPYQEQARANKRGLWQGKFYMPWDWKKLQNKKPKIKVIKTAPSKKGILDI